MSVQLRPKVILKQKDESAYIPVKDLIATLAWTASVDLDLYAFYHANTNLRPRGGLLGWGGVKPGQEGKVYF